MKRQEDKIFAMYPSCVIVEGKYKDAIYDLQRGEYSLIPHSLTYILKNHKRDSIGKIRRKYKENIHFIDEYLDFLIKKDYGILIDKKDNIFVPIQSQSFTPNLITNAIFDYCNSSVYSLKTTIRELTELKCENLEIRFYDYISLEKLEKILSYTSDSTLRDIEIMVQYGNEYNIKSIIDIRLKFKRLRKITIVNCPREKEHIYNHDEIYVIFTTEQVNDETKCGVVGPWYNLPKTELYVESLHYNTCLNHKISIDKDGNIKNCPSMQQSWGKAGITRLVDVVNKEKFQRLWYIKKDDIEKCQDCELRHMCQDCRAYTKEKGNLFSQPAKCHYIS